MPFYFYRILINVFNLVDYGDYCDYQMLDISDEDEIVARREAYLVYRETCICDTSNCNLRDFPKVFHCHGGDFELSSLEEEPELLNQTHSCYTNRNQCFIMLYNGMSKTVF